MFGEQIGQRCVPLLTQPIDRLVGGALWATHHTAHSTSGTNLGTPIEACILSQCRADKISPSFVDDGLNSRSLEAQTPKDSG